jgi:hypothetical protein
MSGERKRVTLITLKAMKRVIVVVILRYLGMLRAGVETAAKVSKYMST